MVRYPWHQSNEGLLGFRDQLHQPEIESLISMLSEYQIVHVLLCIPYVDKILNENAVFL